MELYILDSLYRRIEMVDSFNSLIWTERCRAMGDFQLLINSTLQNRTRFTAGTRLAIKDSYRVMTVETVEDTTDADDRKILKISGPSLEEILEDRVAMSALTDLTTNPKWVLTGTPGVIARKIFHDICVTGILNAGDIIPVIEASIFPVDTISEPVVEITIEIDPTTVYKAIKSVCDLYDLGFRLVRGLDTSLLYFDVYAGSNRTTQQSTLPAVVFSPDLDNLQNTTELTTIDLYKNVAYVVSPVGHAVVYPLDVDPSTAGLDRHVLLVKADDITDTDPAVASAKMIQRGKEELSKSRTFSAFDGEIDQSSQYKYGVHYNLGDIVEMRNIDGATSVMQVTEQIFSQDESGERSYPTLSINRFITPGSWGAWDYNQVWDDLDPSAETWSEQP